MIFAKKTTADIDLEGKRVLLRVDYNVPIKNGQITDTNRIDVTKTTILELISAGVSQIIIVSHFGRPAGFDSDFSLKIVHSELEKILQKPVDFVDDFTTFDFRNSSQIVLLENLRFYPGEKANDLEFARQLVDKTGADVFVQDGFAVCHRKSATTDAITKILPSVASTRLKTELESINNFVNESSTTLAIIGGAKISDKIDFIKAIAKKVDYLAIGGAMANTFLLATGKQIGNSLVELDQVENANKIIQFWQDLGKPLANLILPNDVKTTTDLESENVVLKTTKNVAKNEIIGDLGDQTCQKICDLIDQSQTIIWNGNLGYTENKMFANSTKTVVEKLNNSTKKVLIGGGDTTGFVYQNLQTINNQQMFLSTGGGAMLELIAYQKLPGIESLLDS